ncbi:MAG: substrate-binding domain-containing protein [Caulobacteraceae bacterium]
MNEPYQRAFRLGMAATFALALSSIAHAEPAPQLNVYSTGVAQSAAKVLQLSYAKAVRTGWENGPNFVQTGGTDGRVVGLVKGGADADIVIVQTSEMAGLEQAGLIKPGTAKRLGRVDIGVAVKKGAPRPDVSTYPKFRDALLAAGTVVYTDPKSGSAGGALIERILDKPEFANLKRVHNARVAAGEAPLWLETEGQLSTAYGVDEVGKVPESLKAHLEFSIGVAANSKHPEEALAFENYVLQPQLAPIWTKWGVVR